MGDIDMDVDQDSDQRPSFEAFPEGQYELFISDYKTGTTKGTGRKKMDLELTVNDGPFTGRKMWHTLTFIPKGEPGHGLTVQALKAFGLMQSGETSVSLNFADFENRTCRADVIIEQYEGKGRNKIPPGGFITGEDQAEKKAPATQQQAARQPAAAASKAGGKRPF